MKKGPALILIPALLSIGYAATVLASAASQTGSVTIAPGSEIAFFGEETPDNFDFPTTFVPKSTPTAYVWKTLDPVDPGSLLEIGDNDPTRGFSVTATISDFIGTASNNRIHFDELSVVTLTQTPGATADGSEINDPPGATNVIAPASCGWQSTTVSPPPISDTCTAYVDPFSEVPDAQLANTVNTFDTTITLTNASTFPALGGSIVIEGDDINYTAVSSNDLQGVSGIDSTHNSGTAVFKTTVLTGDVNISDTAINVNDDSIFPSYGWVVIDDDQISYSSVSSGQLQGVTGIDSTHATGTTIKPYQTESQQMTILSNSSLTDVGTYSVGFALRLGIDEGTIPDDYTATITYTLIAIP